MSQMDFFNRSNRYASSQQDRPSHTHSGPPEQPNHDKSQKSRFPEKGLVFVYGALRSGTTALGLMLNAHENIIHLGEVDFLFDHLRKDSSGPGGWRYRRSELAEDRIFRAKDLKLPANVDGRDLFLHMISDLTSGGGGVTALNVHRHAEHLLELLPEARIIHLLRDPRDVARSSIAMGWVGNTYYGVDHWVASEHAWDSIAERLKPDQVLTVRYENLIRNTEVELRRITEFLGMPYRACMLFYHETSTYSPPDPKLVEQWRHKLKPRDIALVESKAGPLMRARNYTPVAPSSEPSAVERLKLWLGNKSYRFGFGIRRYGFALFVGEMLSRRLGAQQLNNRLKRRIAERSVPFLK